jgi:hypothetical protein
LLFGAKNTNGEYITVQRQTLLIALGEKPNREQSENENKNAARPVDL